MLNDTEFDWQHKFTFDVNNFFFGEKENGYSLSKMIQNNNTNTAHSTHHCDIWRHDYGKKTTTATGEEKRKELHHTRIHVHTPIHHARIVRDMMILVSL